jgi:hypothetical protein
LVTTPPHLQRRDLAAVVFFALALGAGSTATSLLILGPMSAFELPVVAMVAFWWNDWPVSRLTTPWNGLIDTVLVVATAVVLTIAGQAVVERSDVRGVFEATPGPGVPVTFPATLVLAPAPTSYSSTSAPCQPPTGSALRTRPRSRYSPRSCVMPARRRPTKQDTARPGQRHK